VREPLVALLTHGATPEKLAAAIAWSFVCSLFPFLGFTTFLNAGVGYWRKLNLPLMQAINYALSPLHLVMILAYVKLGEWLWRAQDERFAIVDMVRSFHELGFGDFLRKFSWAGVHAFTAWALTAPILYMVVYHSARFALLRLSRLRQIEQILPVK
jgi:uncharacterized protein (DUF2062 family)